MHTANTISICFREIVKVFLFKKSEQHLIKKKEQQKQEISLTAND